MKDDTRKRRAYLEELLRVLPKSEPWEAWLERSGELPPDFDAMPSCAGLPDPLEGVADASDWPARREELKQLFRRWVLGSVPPPPDDLAAAVTAERTETCATAACPACPERSRGGLPGRASAVVRQVRLTFAGGKAKLRLELLIPPGDGPFPVFMTQFTHRSWAQIALRRGYLGCVYAGCDGRDDTDTFVEAYPDYDFSRLARRAWAASRCLDYLATVPEADETRVCITGHSRNGKLAVIASALDERFAALISSSSGAGGALSARYYSEQHFGEGIGAITSSFPDWFHPRWRFFTGREHKLPVDLHSLVALSAPRPCLLSIAFNDMVEDARAMQLTYLSARRVYELLGAPEKLRILWRWGQHDTTPKTIERYLDWCDVHFRGASHEFPERLIVPWDWEGWRARSHVTALPRDFAPAGLDDLADLADAGAWSKRREHIRSRVRWMLGDAPPEAAHDPDDQYGTERVYNAAIARRFDVPADLEKHQVVAGEYLSVDVFAPAGTKASRRKLPAVLWLPPACCSQGYVEADTPRNPWWRTVPRAGFVFVSFDPIGHGIRLEEAEGFYERHPEWSLLGKMVRDVSAAVSAVRNLPYVDADRLFAFAFAMGAMVGLHAAALDERLSGLVTLSPPPPFRLDADGNETGGIRRWSHEYMLAPRMGLFTGKEARVPYDVHEIMACVAPRPQLVITARLDREAPVENVTRAVDAARAIYRLHDAAGKLEQVTLEDYARFSEAAETVVLDWLRKESGT